MAEIREVKKCRKVFSSFTNYFGYLGIFMYYSQRNLLFNATGSIVYLSFEYVFPWYFTYAYLNIFAIVHNVRWIHWFNLYEF